MEGDGKFFVHNAKKPVGGSKKKSPTPPPSWNPLYAAIAAADAEEAIANFKGTYTDEDN